MGLELLVPRRRDGADETVGDFVRRRLGREALDRLAGPQLSGIHMADPDNQSLLATFPRFRDLETKHGSLISGMLAQVFACTWTSTKFSHRTPEGSALLRCFVGGHGREELLANDDQELIALVCRELAETIGLRAQSRLAKVFRWPRGTPQYDLGHLDRIRAIRAEYTPYSGLFVAGSAYDGIGVPDCVRQAQQTAKRVLAYLAQRAYPAPAEAMAR